MVHHIDIDWRAGRYDHMGKTRNSIASSKVSRSAFSARLLRVFNKTGIEYRVGGTCALNLYLDMCRHTKDLDVFCRPSDYPRLLQAAREAHFHTEVEDERWIAKVKQGSHFCDIVFGSANSAAPIISQWFKEVHPAKIWGVNVNLLPPTEMIWSKVFIMDRVKFDGNDVAHLILKQYRHVNWKRLLTYMEAHWEVLLIHLLYFRYVYPTERHLVPKWLLEELLHRLKLQEKMPRPQTKVCRGRIFSRDDYMIDIQQWGFADLVGDQLRNGG